MRGEWHRRRPSMRQAHVRCPAQWLGRDLIPPPHQLLPATEPRPSHSPESSHTPAQGPAGAACRPTSPGVVFWLGEGEGGTEQTGKTAVGAGRCSLGSLGRPVAPPTRCTGTSGPRGACRPAWSTAATTTPEACPRQGIAEENLPAPPRRWGVQPTSSFFSSSPFSSSFCSPPPPNEFYLFPAARRAAEW